MTPTRFRFGEKESISEAYHKISESDISDIDAKYEKAVKSGDTATALSLIRERAAKAMPDTKVVDADGLPMVVYHGTKWRWDSEKIGYAVLRSRPFFTDSHSVAKDRYGSNVIEAFVNIVNPLVSDNEGSTWLGCRVPDSLMEKGAEYWDSDLYDGVTDGYEGLISTDAFARLAAESGYDGAIMYDVDEEGTLFVPKSSVQVKLADITYNDDMSVIPLSMRFDFTKDDIRY